MNYGLPYQGSKNRIAKRLVDALPPAPVLYDVFCGGCAVTHAAMLSGKYQRFVINDRRGWLPDAFRKAIHGDYAHEDRWISREDFDRLKSTDAYAALCFSFGNNCRSYMYAPLLSVTSARCTMRFFGEILRRGRRSARRPRTLSRQGLRRLRTGSRDAFRQGNLSLRASGFRLPPGRSRRISSTSRYTVRSAGRRLRRIALRALSALSACRALRALSALSALRALSACRTR